MILYKKADAHIESGCKMFFANDLASSSSKDKNKNAWSFLGGNSGVPKGKQKVRADESGSTGEKYGELL